MIGPVANSVPVTWQDRTSRLGAALASFPTGGHLLSLCVSGALLQRGVAPEAVPAIVDVATARAGWKQRSPGHYRRNAEDTVRRFGSGLPIRSDVPPELVGVLDEITNQQPAATTTLAEEQQRLYRALADPPAGVSVVRCPCGAGKTHQARRVAAERSARRLRTTISVPTNELAIQIAVDLATAGVPVRRVFGPLSIEGPGACAFRAAATHLAAGWQSVTWELCEGRGRDRCPHYSSCQARLGMEGPDDALVLVGNHALLSELVRATPARGLLVIDEPPEVLSDHVLRDDDLVEAQDQLTKFEDGHHFAPALLLARAWLRQAPVDEPHALADVDPDCDPALAAGATLGDLLEQAGAMDVVAAISEAIPERYRAPRADRLQLITTRTDPVRAGRLGRASLVLAVLHRALTDPSVRTTVQEHHRSGERSLGVVGLAKPLVEALQRDGDTVVTAADAHLYLEHYAAVLPYEPPLTTISAPDGCQVRRVILERRLSRRQRPAEELLHEALALAATAGPRIAIVTHLAWEAWAAEVGDAWAAGRSATIATGHYRALRGLDHWRDFDALVTLGDPIPNLNAVARQGAEDVQLRANDLARAELEQAHGRLRTVHRKTPCTQVHVGKLVPLGWPATYEVHAAQGGRRSREEGDCSADELRELVGAVGGVSATARAAGVARQTVHRWLKGEHAPPPKVVAALRFASQGGNRSKRAKGGGQRG